MDGAIIFVSFLAFGEIELILVGVMALFISSYSIDWVISKLNISRLAFVITSDGEKMPKHL